MANGVMRREETARPEMIEAASRSLAELRSLVTADHHNGVGANTRLQMTRLFQILGIEPSESDLSRFCRGESSRFFMPSFMIPQLNRQQTAALRDFIRTHGLELLKNDEINMLATGERCVLGAYLAEGVSNRDLNAFARDARRLQDLGIHIVVGPGREVYIYNEAGKLVHDLARDGVAVEFSADRSLTVSNSLYVSQNIPDQARARIELAIRTAQDSIRTGTPASIDSAMNLISTSQNIIAVYRYMEDISRLRQSASQVVGVSLNDSEWNEVKRFFSRLGPDEFRRIMGISFAEFETSGRGRLSLGGLALWKFTQVQTILADIASSYLESLSMLLSGQSREMAEQRCRNVQRSMQYVNSIYLQGSILMGHAWQIYLLRRNLESLSPEQRADFPGMNRELLEAQLLREGVPQSMVSELANKYLEIRQMLADITQSAWGIESSLKSLAFYSLAALAYNQSEDAHSRQVLQSIQISAREARNRISALQRLAEQANASFSTEASRFNRRYEQATRAPSSEELAATYLQRFGRYRRMLDVVEAGLDDADTTNMERELIYSALRSMNITIEDVRAILDFAISRFRDTPNTLPTIEELRTFLRSIDRSELAQGLDRSTELFERTLFAVIDFAHKVSWRHRLNEARQPSMQVDRRQAASHNREQLLAILNDAHEVADIQRNLVGNATRRRTPSMPYSDGLSELERRFGNYRDLSLSRLREYATQYASLYSRTIATFESEVLQPLAFERSLRQLPPARRELTRAGYYLSTHQEEITWALVGVTVALSFFAGPIGTETGAGIEAGATAALTRTGGAVLARRVTTEMLRRYASIGINEAFGAMGLAGKIGLVVSGVPAAALFVFGESSNTSIERQTAIRLLSFAGHSAALGLLGPYSRGVSALGISQNVYRWANVGTNSLFFGAAGLNLGYNIYSRAYSERPERDSLAHFDREMQRADITGDIVLLALPLMPFMFRSVRGIWRVAPSSTEAGVFQNLGRVFGSDRSLTWEANDVVLTGLLVADPFLRNDAVERARETLAPRREREMGRIRPRVVIDVQPENLIPELREYNFNPYPVFSAQEFRSQRPRRTGRR